MTTTAASSHTVRPRVGALAVGGAVLATAHYSIDTGWWWGGSRWA